jgi:3-oxoacyl-[acyl-carrier protein] reductase
VTLHAAGARVAIVGRSAEGAATAAAAIGDGVRGYGCDITDRAAMRSTIDACEKDLGPIDILVNNAGVTHDNLLIRMSDADWDAVIASNLTAAFVAIQGVIKGMMKRRSGRIINITSVVGVTGNKGQANYAASKAGLVGLARAIARELGSRSITANVIAPGFVETDMTAAMTDARRAEVLAGIPLQRYGTVDEIAGAALYLASDAAAYVTGAVLAVDGGIGMGL